jgi:hypothetical protein
MQKTILSKYHWLEGSLDLKAEFLRLLSKAEYAEFLAKNGLSLSRVVVSPNPYSGGGSRYLFRGR